MAPLPDRTSLENMKRADLQKLCKDYGVKANLKSEALIDLLIDAQKPITKIGSTRRSVSTRHPSRAGPSRVSSIIIHDTDDEEDEEHPTTSLLEPASEPQFQSEPTPPATRTKKAREQTRLGVGRPAVAGGSGPRAITKSLSISKGKRGKSSRTTKPSEATIPEEEEIVLQEPIAEHLHNDPPVDKDNLHSSIEISADIPLTSPTSLEEYVAEALRPLQEQMKSLQSELILVQSLKVEFGQLKAQTDEIKNLRERVEVLTADVEDLRTRTMPSAAVGNETLQPTQDITQKLVPLTPSLQISVEAHAEPSGQLATNSTNLSSFSPAPDVGTTHPGIAPTMLGKRHRDSAESDTISVDQGDEALSDVPGVRSKQPTRKRLKIAEGDNTEDQPSPGKEEETEAQSAPHDSIFCGLDLYVDPPPPTNHLPSFFAPPSSPGSGPSSSRPPVTSTANASENQQPFSFSFIHPSSTPSNSMFMPSFPYPEPPQSPSPAVSNSGEFLNRDQGSRSDVFLTFGLPPPGRLSRSSSSHNGGTGSGKGFIDPIALMQQLPDRHESITIDTDVRNETSKKSIEAEPSTMGPRAIPQMKRTMYGTELEGDTRFGDFGVEGVGNSQVGFWAGGRH